MRIAETAALLVADFDGHMGWDGGWGVVMVLGMILFWALVIVAVVWIARELAARPRSTEDDPLRLLDRRLADGTLSPEDYARRKAILTGEEPPG
jgi:putative membrane protein